MRTVVEVDNLTKRFQTPEGVITAVDQLSFSIHEGEIVGFLGPNGAGKTTTIRMLLSIIIPDEGSIRLLGKNLFLHREEILRDVNFTFVNSTFGG